MESKINYKSFIVCGSDSPLKKFFKEYFSGNQTRYTRADFPIAKQYAVSESKKDKFWQTNLLKIALCFTVVIPIVAGIYKLVEMKKLYNYTFVSSRDLKPDATAAKVDQVKSRLEKNESKDIPVFPIQQTHSSHASDTSKGLHSVSKVEKLEHALKFEHIDAVNKSMVENCEQFLNYLYIVLSPSDQILLKKLKDLNSRYYLKIKITSQSSKLADPKGGVNPKEYASYYRPHGDSEVFAKGNISDHTLFIKTRLLTKFKKAEVPFIALKTEIQDFIEQMQQAVDDLSKLTYID